jgi:hypothetical protein
MLVWNCRPRLFMFFLLFPYAQFSLTFALPDLGDVALSRRCRRLDSAQLPPEWNTSTSLRNASSLKGVYPFNFMSHHRGAVQIYQPYPPPSSQDLKDLRDSSQSIRLASILLAFGVHQTLEAKLSKSMRT